MAEERPTETVLEPLLAAWIKWTMDFWESLAQLGPRQSEAWATAAAFPEGGRSVPEDFSRLALRMWEAFFSLLSDPRTVDAVFRGIKAPSGIVLKMAQTGWEAYSQLHRQWLEGGHQDAVQVLEELDEHTFKAWTEIYEKEFQQLVNLSRAGLVQVSPEKLSQGVAKFGQYQAAMAEFINLLYLPMRKSLQVMQDEMTELAWEEGLDADFKQYYKKWLKILEGQYLTLSKSPQYRRTLAYVLNALVDFTVAKQALLAEALRFLPFPSPQEMDALYQEIYLLKKRLKEVERRMAKPGTS